MARRNSEDQPFESGFNHHHRQDRDVNVLIGLCSGVMLDGSINALEAQNLLLWLAAKPHICDRWPASHVYDRLQYFLADGELDENEESELIELLQQVTGGQIDLETGEAMATALPFCDPVPEVILTDRCISLTGKFQLASRTRLKAILEHHGAKLHDSPLKATDYLVVGSIGSRDWKFASFGRKIERAVTMRDEGCKIRIISEESLAKSIGCCLQHQCSFRLVQP